MPRRSSQQVAADSQIASMQKAAAESSKTEKVRSIAKKENAMAAAEATSKSTASRPPTAVAIKASKVPIKKPEKATKTSKCDELLTFIITYNLFTPLILFNR